MSFSAQEWVARERRECEAAIQSKETALQETKNRLAELARLMDAIHQVEDPHRGILEPDAAAIEGQIKDSDQAMREHLGEIARLRKRLTALHFLSNEL